MATEKRLIDADALMNYIRNHDYQLVSRMGCVDKGMFTDGIEHGINIQPTVDAVEVVHGEWSTIEDDYTGLVALQCSVCNQEYWFEDEPPIKIYNYCPNCGANMRGSE